MKNKQLMFLFLIINKKNPLDGHILDGNIILFFLTLTSLAYISKSKSDWPIPLIIIKK